MPDALAPPLAALALFLVAAGDPRPVVVEVRAGAHDRRDTPITLPLPGELEGAAAVRLETLDGDRPVACRVVPGPRGEVAWILEAPLAAGKSRRYRLSPTAPADPARPAVAFESARGTTGLRLDGRVVLTYHDAVAEPPEGIGRVFRRSGFVHPLTTRSGRVVTDDFPPDHAHQHGLFFAWVNTTFDGRAVDFWNQAKKTGTVENVDDGGGPQDRGGPVVATCRKVLRHVALDPSGRSTPVIEETWDLRGYDVPGLVVVDIESTQSCAGDRPLTINKYHYGGLGLRGNRGWSDRSAKGEAPPDPARAGRSDFLTSEGKHRGDGNHTRPRWVDLHGEVDGATAGVAILDHPTNFRFPQPVRLHPNMPYFCFAPMVLGAFAIEPGRPYVSRYRIVAHDGPPDPAALERLWADYADPPRVEVVP